MKYIIENKKLFDIIYKFIDEEFAEDNLAWEYMEDYDNGTYDTNIIEFSGDKYFEGEVDNKYFTYIKREYYENLTDDFDNEFKTSWIDKAPLLDLTTGEWYFDKLKNLFGEYWKPVFEQWFRDSYPDFPVKTFWYP